MAATTLLKFGQQDQNDLAVEIIKAEIGPAETECDITPTYLKSIQFVSVQAMDAASAATLIGYLKGSAFVPGQGTCTIVGDNSTTYLVKLEGKV